MAFPTQSFVSGEWLRQLLLGETHNLDTDTIKMALYGPTAAPNPDLSLVYGSVVGELSGGGYTAGGATLTNPTITINTTDNLVVFSAGGNVTFPGLTAAAIHGALIYNSTRANRVLAGLSWEVNPRSVVAGTFTVPPDGVIGGLFGIGY